MRKKTLVRYWSKLLRSC